MMHKVPRAIHRSADGSMGAAGAPSRSPDGRAHGAASRLARSSVNGAMGRAQHLALKIVFHAARAVAAGTAALAFLMAVAFFSAGLAPNAIACAVIALIVGGASAALFCHDPFRDELKPLASEKRR